MSAGAKVGKAGSGEGGRSQSAEPQATVRPSSLAAGRADAARQIHRSLKAWRDQEEASVEPSAQDRSDDREQADDAEGDKEEASDHDEAKSGEAGVAKEEGPSKGVKLAAKLQSLSRKVYRSGKGKPSTTGYYRGGSSMVGRKGIDYKVKDGMVQPGKGISLNKNPEDKFVVQYGGAFGVMSYPDTLVIVGSGQHVELCAKAPMPEAAFIAACNSVVLQKYES